MPEGVEIKPKITKGGKGSRSKKGKGEDGDEGSSVSLPLCTPFYISLIIPRAVHFHQHLPIQMPTSTIHLESLLPQDRKQSLSLKARSMSLGYWMSRLKLDHRGNARGLLEGRSRMRSKLR